VRRRGWKKGGSDRSNFIGYRIANQHETCRRFDERLEIGEVNIAAMRDQTSLDGRIRARDGWSGRADEIGRGFATSDAPSNFVRVLLPAIAASGKSSRRDGALPLLDNMGGFVRGFIQCWLCTETDLFASGERG